MEYLIILIYLLVCIYCFDKRKIKGADIHYIIMLILFVLISGLAYRVGTDAIRYEDKFYTDFRSLTPELKLSEVFETGLQPFWYLVNWLFYHLTGDWVVFKLCISLFFNGTIFWFVKRHCAFPFTAILLYFIFIYFEYNFESLRETFAICFMLIALDKFSGASGTEKNYVKFYLWVWPAIFFHTFGFIALLFPFFSYFKYNIWLVLLSTVILAVVSMQVESLFSLNFLSLLSEDDIQRMLFYANSDTYGTTGHNINAYISLFVRNIVAPLILIKNKKSDNFQSWAITYVAVTVVASFILIFYRLGNYFIIPMAVALSESWGNAVYRKDYRFLSLGILKNKFVFIVCILLMLSMRYSALMQTELWEHFYPYSAIYNKHSYNRELLIDWTE